MTPEAMIAVAQPQLEPLDNSMWARSRVCPRCAEPSARPLDAGSDICERCLFNLALESSEPDSCGNTGESPALPLEARFFGPYILIEEIGRGGQGVIFRAAHRETGQFVAIKSVLPQDSGCVETLTRFRREAEAAQSVDHPHSMPILHVGCSDDGAPYYSMVLAEGGSLHQLGAKYRGRWRRIAKLLVKISRAVHHAHKEGIVHRDLKPGNILFTADHEPLVTDFGLAKRLAGTNDVTQSCTVLGTPNYVSPEQAAGNTRDLTAASDIYSLGAILFELLTERPPFVGDNPLAVLQQVATGTPKRPRRLAPAIPRVLETICLRCLERRPEDRYDSAQALADDLDCWLQGRKISFPTFRARLRRHVRWPAIYACSLGFICTLLALCTIWIFADKPVLASPPMTSIAVAIEDFDQDPALHEIARTATTSLKGEIAKITSFRVMDSANQNSGSQTEIFDPLKYGRLVNAELILAGNVCTADHQVRFNVRLLRCDTGDVVWRNTTAASWPEARSKVQTIAKAIVGSLHKIQRSDVDAFRVHSGPSPDAQAFYTKAMELTVHRNRRDMSSAVELFRKSCVRDPHFVQARAMLALALLTQATLYEETTLLPTAMSTANEALTLDSNSAQAHRVVGSCYFKQSRYKAAIPEFRRAVELDPQAAGCVQALGVCLREMGKPEEALAWLRRAVRLAPGRGAFSASLGETLAICGVDDEAETVLMHAAELDQDRPDAQISMSALRIWQRRFADAHLRCTDARQRFPDCQSGSALAAWIAFSEGDFQEAKSKFETLKVENSFSRDWEFFGAINPSSALAYLAMLAGSFDEARGLAQEALKNDRDLLNKNPGNCRVLHDLAATYSVIGDEGQALNYLQQALDEGWTEYRSTLMDRRFAAIAKTQRFERLLGGASQSLTAKLLSGAPTSMQKTTRPKQ